MMKLARVVSTAMSDKRQAQTNEERFIVIGCFLMKIRGEGAMPISRIKLGNLILQT